MMKKWWNTFMTTSNNDDQYFKYRIAEKIGRYRQHLHVTGNIDLDVCVYNDFDSVSCEIYFPLNYTTKIQRGLFIAGLCYSTTNLSSFFNSVYYIDVPRKKDFDKLLVILQTIENVSITYDKIIVDKWYEK